VSTRNRLFILLSYDNYVFCRTVAFHRKRAKRCDRARGNETRQRVMESTPEQTAEGVAVVRVLAAVLERLVNANAQMNQNEVQVTKFHALRAPSISILQYLER